MADSIKRQFEKLAKEKNPRARSLLMRKLTAEYARRTGDAPSDMERELFSALVFDLYDQIDPGVRRDIITLLARTRHITALLAERLAGEEDEIVTTLYEHSPMLSDTLLLHSVRVRSEAVLIAIARRNEVPEELVDALMARAYRRVVGQLLRNGGARFSGNALLLCTINCRTSRENQSLLAARCLSDEEFHARVRMHVEQGCPFLPVAFTQAALDGTLDKLVGNLQEDVDKLELEGEAVTREEAVAQINLGELSFDALLATLIDGQRKEDIIWFLKDARGLSANAMEHLLVTNGNQTLTRMLVELQVSLKTYKALLRWRIDTLGIPDRHLYRDIEDYRQKLKLHH